MPAASRRSSLTKRVSFASELDMVTFEDGSPPRTVVNLNCKSKGCSSERTGRNPPERTSTPRTLLFLDEADLAYFSSLEQDADEEDFNLGEIIMRLVGGRRSGSCGIKTFDFQSWTMWQGVFIMAAFTLACRAWECSTDISALPQ
eukprot:gb/GEZN01014690.1/.p1 GENE.gb/GEZN01014690.1/~~gb/GEZN01014690.1/.p1  ORF type:complete len:145 (+),score=9.42 gb/GEZN01014690.1/:142-576(+)